MSHVKPAGVKELRVRMTHRWRELDSNHRYPKDKLSRRQLRPEPVRERCQRSNMSHHFARGASFVSVTQQFNTTTSMGRLTLNVLLSFAHFEREVIGERIRDKIAASKKKAGGGELGVMCRFVTHRWWVAPWRGWDGRQFLLRVGPLISV
jgi:hypothetical protein